ncbi:hypothetical protein Y032_0086g1962 [Ancylostoma ceylanicum]|uniref:Uncharacterized protein n=1 Tax=Ancylostoma ceylanicum TaxID=53326 RepID=A0A016TPM7_9BILA|nr:hypothetical protein Y032_0086g1962 [Ancylostoma ceylanicum]
MLVTRLGATKSVAIQSSWQLNMAKVQAKSILNKNIAEEKLKFERSYAHWNAHLQNGHYFWDNLILFYVNCLGKIFSACSPGFAAFASADIINGVLTEEYRSIFPCKEVINCKSV